MQNAMYAPARQPLHPMLSQWTYSNPQAPFPMPAPMPLMASHPMAAPSGHRLQPQAPYWAYLYSNHPQVMPAPHPLQPNDYSQIAAPGHGLHTMDPYSYLDGTQAPHHLFATPIATPGASTAPWRAMQSDDPCPLSPLDQRPQQQSALLVTPAPQGTDPRGDRGRRPESRLQLPAALVAHPPPGFQTVPAPSRAASHQGPRTSAEHQAPSMPPGFLQMTTAAPQGPVASQGRRAITVQPEAPSLPESQTPALPERAAAASDQAAMEQEGPPHQPNLQAAAASGGSSHSSPGRPRTVAEWDAHRAGAACQAAATTEAFQLALQVTKLQEELQEERRRHTALRKTCRNKQQIIRREKRKIEILKEKSKNKQERTKAKKGVSSPSATPDVPTAPSL